MYFALQRPVAETVSEKLIKIFIVCVLTFVCCGFEPDMAYYS